MNKGLKLFFYLLFFVTSLASLRMLEAMDRDIPFYQQYEQKGFKKKNIWWDKLKREMPQLKDMPELRRSLKKAYHNEGWTFRKYEKSQFTLLGKTWLKHIYITKHRVTSWPDEHGVVRPREEIVLHENVREIPERTLFLLSFLTGAALAIVYDAACRYLK